MASSMPTSQTTSEATEKRDEYIGKLIGVFRPVLLETLRVSHILCLLDIKEVKEGAAKVHKMENSGDFKGAAKELLDAISRSDTPGKWCMFLDAVKEVDDTVILDIILQEGNHEADDWLDNQENRKLIDLFSRSIQEELNLEPLLPVMMGRNLITENDQEQLLSYLSQHGRQFANIQLLMVMHRHESDWYKIFLNILYDSEEHRHLARMIDPGFCEKKIEAQRSRQQPALSSHGASLATAPHTEFQSASQIAKDPSSQRKSVSGIKTSSQTELGTSTSLTLNMGASSGHSVKDIKDKSVPHRLDLNAMSRSETTQDAPLQKDQPTCGCGCCSRMILEVQSNRADVASLKAELSQIKTLLQVLVKSKSLNQEISLDVKPATATRPYRPK